MNSLVITIIVAAVVFAILWWSGQLTRLSAYLAETREELRRCTWPTWTELKGSTAVVLVSLLILAVFTFVVDWFFTLIVRKIT
jgi:preprotein translocase SecE subunit